MSPFVSINIILSLLDLIYQILVLTQLESDQTKLKSLKFFKKLQRFKRFLISLNPWKDRSVSNRSIFLNLSNYLTLCEKIIFISELFRSYIQVSTGHQLFRFSTRARPTLPVTVHFWYRWNERRIHDAVPAESIDPCFY